MGILNEYAFQSSKVPALPRALIASNIAATSGSIDLPETVWQINAVFGRAR